MKRRGGFAICVRNRSAEDLEVRKVYELLPDSRAAKDGCVRVIDESGEDYLRADRASARGGRSLSISKR